MKTKNKSSIDAFLSSTTKEKVLGIFDQHGDDIAIGQLIDELRLYQKLEVASLQAQTGQVVDHDEVFRRLEQHEKN